MKIFSELHHSGLFASFHYLFENRLGFDLYRPIGEEWFTEGYWKIAEPYDNNAGTITQFLGIRQDFVPKDGTPPLNDVKEIQDDVYYIWDGTHGYHQKAISLNKFLSMDFDVIIASIPSHIDAYSKLIKNHNLKAKLIYHIGNIGWHEHVPFDKAKNIMASVKRFKVPDSNNVVFYRQEFDLNVFKPSQLTTQWVTSFVNCLPNPDLWNRLKELMTPDYEFKAFGIDCPDGIWGKIQEIASYMATSKYGYHFKPGGDGFGHTVYNWLAVGRPILINLKDYRDKLAGEFLIEEKTCIDISDLGAAEIAYRISNISDLQYQDMRNNMIEKSKEILNFNREAEDVKAFIERLL